MLTRAHRRTGGVPPERIVRHVLSVALDGDWPVQRDAPGGLLYPLGTVQGPHGCAVSLDS